MDLHAELYAAAREEVGWFFAAGDAAMGLHGKDYGGVGAGVWDDARIHNAHVSRRRWDHQYDVVRRGRIHETLSKLAPEHFADLRAAWTPFGASRTTWQARCVFMKGKRALIGLALRTQALAVAYARKVKDESAPRPATETLLRWIEDEVATLKNVKPGKALPPGHRLEPALREALRREEGAIAAYDELRRARIEAQRQPSVALLEAKRRERALKEKARFDAWLAADREKMG